MSVPGVVGGRGAASSNASRRVGLSEMTRQRTLFTDYLSRLRRVLSCDNPPLSESVRLDFKKCFGAVAAYADGNIFASSGAFGIALKLPPSLLSDLFKEPGVTRLKYFKNGHVKKNYAVIPQHILRDRGRLRELINASVSNAVCGRRKQVGVGVAIQRRRTSPT